MKTNKIVKQHNDFIRNRIIIDNLVSTRILMSFIANIKKDDEDFYAPCLSAWSFLGLIEFINVIMEVKSIE